VIAAITL